MLGRERKNFVTIPCPNVAALVPKPEVKAMLLE